MSFVLAVVALWQADVAEAARWRVKAAMVLAAERAEAIAVREAEIGHLVRVRVRVRVLAAPECQPAVEVPGLGDARLLGSEFAAVCDEVVAAVTLGVDGLRAQADERAAAVLLSVVRGLRGLIGEQEILLDQLQEHTDPDVLDLALRLDSATAQTWRRAVGLGMLCGAAGGATGCDAGEGRAARGSGPGAGLPSGGDSL